MRSLTPFLPPGQRVLPARPAPPVLSILRGSAQVLLLQKPFLAPLPGSRLTATSREQRTPGHEALQVFAPGLNSHL